MLLVLDNITGHTTPAFVCWLMDHGVMPLYTPLGGSWLNMTESVPRILIRRGLADPPPENVGAIITALEATAAGLGRPPRGLAPARSRAPAPPRRLRRLHAPPRHSPPPNCPR